MTQRNETDIQRVACRGTQLPGFDRGPDFYALYIVRGFHGFVAIHWTSDRGIMRSAVAIKSKPACIADVDFATGIIGAYKTNADIAKVAAGAR